MNEGLEIAYRKSIGLQIKIQLIRMHRTQYEAAELAGITPAQIGSVINGRSAYTIDTLTKLVAANNLNLEINLEIFNRY